MLSETVITNNKCYQIQAFWDTEARVWVASSDDVIGLVTEANSLENLTEKLRVMIPELLILNQQISDNYTGSITFEILSHRQELIEVA